MSDPQVFGSKENICIRIPVEGSFRPAVAEAYLLEKMDDVPEKYWWISRVVVPEKARGQGVGSALLKALFKEVEKEQVKLIVVAPGGYGSKEEDLQKFYKKNGFTQVPKATDGFLQIRLKG